jgi:glycosyltransferase involved in cell wall biosynthesis
MKVSIVVPAYNEEKLLGGTLDCIRAATLSLPQVEWELIVCDNNSTDRTAEIARQHGARVVFQPVNQISKARNAGAAAATGEWLLFVDADSRPQPALLADFLRETQNNCMAGGATIVLEDVGPLVQVWVRLWNLASRINSWAAGSFIFCETSAFREVGGFSLELYASEEIDLFRKLKRLARQRGKRIVILHRHPLRTSGRKAHLYTTAEMMRFALRTALTGGRALKSRKDCFAWYDGRR